MKDYGTTPLDPTLLVKLADGYSIEINGISFSAFRDYVSKTIKESVESESSKLTLKEQKNTRDSMRQKVDSFMKSKLTKMTSFSLDLVPGKLIQSIHFL